MVGGRGGAGASTLAVALALTATSRRLRCLLLDADPLGGGLDLVLGGEDQLGVRWPELADAHGRVNGAALRDALPAFDGLTVLSWDRGDLLSIPADAMLSVLGAGRRSFDLIVVDLPRRPDAAAEEALAQATHTLLVVPAEVRATAAAARVATALAEFTADIQVVVRGPAPSGLYCRPGGGQPGPAAGRLRPGRTRRGGGARARRGAGGPRPGAAGAVLPRLPRRPRRGSVLGALRMTPRERFPRPRKARDLLDRVRARLATADAEPTPARVAAALRAEGRVLGDAAVLGVVGTLRAELAGAGPLEALLRDPAVTDVLVNAPGEVWVDRGRGLERAAASFADDAAVRRLAQRLVSAAGRRLDDACPFADAVLPDGTRLHAVLAPVAVGGTAVSLRVPRRRAFTLAELVAAGSVPPAGAAWLSALVAGRLAFLVTGGTGTGKTTLLSSLLSLVDPGERLILVEDSRELRPAHPHVVRLEARPPNVEGAGAVTLRDLVRQALRMRPDRLVVGEVRGPEVVDLLAALNTGHEGGCGTLHANAAAEIPARLEALAAAAGMGRAALHSQLAAGVDAAVHLVRDGAGRRVAEVGVLARSGGGAAALVPALVFEAGGVERSEPGATRLAELLRRRGVVVPGESGRGGPGSGGAGAASPGADSPGADDLGAGGLGSGGLGSGEVEPGAVGAGR